MYHEQAIELGPDATDDEGETLFWETSECSSPDCHRPLGHYLGRSYSNPDVDEEKFSPPWYFGSMPNRWYCEDCVSDKLGNIFIAESYETFWIEVSGQEHGFAAMICTHGRDHGRTWELEVPQKPRFTLAAAHLDAIQAASNILDDQARLEYELEVARARHEHQAQTQNQARLVP